MAERLTGKAGQEQSATVLEAYGTTCHLCGRDCADDFTVDHLTPLAAGGTNDLGNLRPAHGKSTPSCRGNYSRGAAPLVDPRPSRVW